LHRLSDICEYPIGDLLAVRAIETRLRALPGYVKNTSEMLENPTIW
jgi:hypothetical protein